VGSKDEFGPDTESIRAWLSKRATYAHDARVVAESPQPPSRIAGAGELDSTELGRSVVEALRPDGARRAERPATTTPDGSPTPAGPPAGVRVEPDIGRGRWTEPPENLTALEAGTDAEFPVRSAVRRSLTAVLLAVLAGTGAASYVAAREPTTATVGVAATLGCLLLVVWAVRAGTTTTALAVRRGQLRITRQGRTEVVDVASPYTPIAIVGEPGERRWTVLIERDGLPLVVITRSMVDPHWFTTVLYRLRPALRPPSGSTRPSSDAVAAEA